MTEDEVRRMFGAIIDDRSMRPAIGFHGVSANLDPLVLDGGINFADRIFEEPDAASKIDHARDFDFEEIEVGEDEPGELPRLLSRVHLSARIVIVRLVELTIEMVSADGGFRFVGLLHGSKREARVGLKR